MATDILCGPPEHPDFAIVQAPVLKVEGRDFILDSAERRKSPTPTFRRAITHDQSDGLTINFNNDYPGGVTLNGVVSITPHLEPAKFALPSSVGTLAVHGDISYEVGGIKLGGGAAKITVSLSQQIAQLNDQISKLTARVTALGG
jgi:hypothetical protein